MFEMDEVDNELISTGIAFDLKDIYTQWNFSVSEILKEAKLTKPSNGLSIKGGYKGIHTEHLGHILTEMQYLQRAHPGAKW